MFSKFLRLSLVFATLLTFSACVYKIDIFQGNVLEETQIAQLETGMLKADVISLLGTPQLIDPFHTDRWNYYSLSETNNQRDKEQEFVTLLFTDDILVEIILPE